MRTCAQYLVAFCNRLERASDVISGKFVRQIAAEKCVKFSHPRLNDSGEILPETIGIGNFDSFFRYKFRSEVDNDVISVAAGDYIDPDVRIKFGGSRLNSFEIFDELLSCRTN